MSNDKENKIDFWKNFVIFGILALIISCIFIFQIPIHFSVFENIGTMGPIMVITITIIIIMVVILEFLLVIYKIRRKEQSEGMKENNKLRGL